MASLSALRPAGALSASTFRAFSSRHLSSVATNRPALTTCRTWTSFPQQAALQGQRPAQQTRLFGSSTSTSAFQHGIKYRAGMMTSITATATAATSSRTLMAAGAATTCMFGPLIWTRAFSGAGSALSSSSSMVKIAYCAGAAPGMRYEDPRLATPPGKKPLINTKELTFGTAMGLCSGYLFKKLGKMVMLLVGLSFLSLQLLANSGYIQVNWTLIESRFIEKFDVDKDGKVTLQDARHGFRALMGLLTRNFQFKSTFVGGFVLGFRYG